MVYLNYEVDDDGTEFVDMLALPGREQAPDAGRGDERGRVKALLGLLGLRELQVVSLRNGLGVLIVNDASGHAQIAFDEQLYGISMTLEEVGRLLKVTRERVRQIESKAYRKLGGSAAAARLFPELAESDTAEDGPYLPGRFPVPERPGDRRLSLGVADLGLEMRESNALLRCGCTTVGDVLATHPDDWIGNLPGFGPQGWLALTRALDALGFWFEGGRWVSDTER